MIGMRGQLILAALCLVGAFLASAWVNAVSRLSPVRAELLMERHPKRAAILVKIADDSSTFLTSVLVVMLILRVSVTVLVTSVILNLDVA